MMVDYFLSTIFLFGGQKKGDLLENGDRSIIYTKREK